ncbi:RNA polymerase subunit sigma-70 [Virgibacillus sp. MSP4-1]|uniref:RNA polymerase subunit sigma-70 n=1 Tax=Salinibacillus aidingensis TaxID=237684 RepID=A0ABP3KMV8_9BACI|nr:RNA polymerase subunit sigma-70 [Virgibacillus sp. MSP4-1]QHS22870.1 RNA polymerase subunit sigma-70 [Virgibacillus sp. MSP4-1]
MRTSGNRNALSYSDQGIFQIDFHHFMNSEKEQSSMELAQEFGLSLKDVKNLKERLTRS